MLASRRLCVLASDAKTQRRRCAQDVFMYIDQSKKPYPFCPGCSHGLVLDAIDRALNKVNADPKKVVLVSDIGCVGMADKYFNVHTFHGLHGRSFTYACGIKLANPELLVFVVVGDGGCGIGGHHLINAARRNIGIKVLCFNNHNFGMTGGQHSVTTPLNAKTTTTPMGSLERPFDLAGLVSAAGAPFVARVKAYDRDLDEIIAMAFKHDGFSFVDCWEFCTAYFMPANEYKRQQMDELIESYGFKTGILREVVEPEYSKLLNECSRRACSAMAKQALPLQIPIGVETKFKHNLKKDSVSIVLAGSAGMKVISAAHNFGEAALLSGLWASQKDDYPVTVKSGHSVSDIKISRERIDYLGVDKPDAVLVVSGDGLKEVSDIFASLGPDSVIIIAKGLNKPETAARIVEMDFTGIEKTVHATAALARLLKLNEFIPLDAYRAAIEGIGKDKIREINLKALEWGIKSK